MANTEPERAIDESLSTGTGVQVRTRFDGRWATGFEIADVHRSGAAPPIYRIRRRSDGRVLPGFFPVDQLRRKLRAGAHAPPLASR